ncbi:hypothetical protein B0H13DRAFT_2269646 [Mycena leptocephala]|nr:hypothetical protein B0H13DRAFT_2269646 [Mycena leptocephala]
MGDLLEREKWMRRRRSPLPLSPLGLITGRETPPTTPPPKPTQTQTPPMQKKKARTSSSPPAHTLAERYLASFGFPPFLPMKKGGGAEVRVGGSDRGKLAGRRRRTRRARESRERKQKPEDEEWERLADGIAHGVDVRERGTRVRVPDGKDVWGGDGGCRGGCCEFVVRWVCGDVRASWPPRIGEGERCGTNANAKAIRTPTVTMPVFAPPVKARTRRKEVAAAASPPFSSFSSISRGTTGHGSPSPLSAVFLASLVPTSASSAPHSSSADSAHTASRAQPQLAEGAQGQAAGAPQEDPHAAPSSYITHAAPIDAVLLRGRRCGSEWEWAGM